MDSFEHIPQTGEPVLQPEPLAAPAPVPPPPIDDGRNAVVDLLDVFLIVVAAGIAYFFFGVLATVVYMVLHGGNVSQEQIRLLSRNAFFAVSIQFSVYLLLVGFMALLVWVRHRVALAQAIRWNLPMRRRAVYAFAGGVLLAFASDLAELVLHRWIPKSLPITEFFQDRSSALLLAGFGIMVAPLVEEMLFRGFLYPAISRWAGVAPAVVVTAAGFALLHGAQLAFSLVPLLLIFIVGVVLTVVRARTKSVATSVLVHMAYNFTLFPQFYIGTQGFRNLQG